MLTMIVAADVPVQARDDVVGKGSVNLGFEHQAIGQARTVDASFAVRRRGVHNNLSRYWGCHRGLSHQRSSKSGSGSCGLWCWRFDDSPKDWWENGTGKGGKVGDDHHIHSTLRAQPKPHVLGTCLGVLDRWKETRHRDALQSVEEVAEANSYRV
jgi:hypothetical protein